MKKFDLVIVYYKPFKRNINKLQMANEKIYASDFETACGIVKQRYRNVKEIYENEL